MHGAYTWCIYMCVYMCITSVTKVYNGTAGVRRRKGTM
jgi:hypothetical protein